jgi:hypothetical protein
MQHSTNAQFFFLLKKVVLLTSKQQRGVYKYELLLA